MDDRYERHCLADPLFYDEPGRAEPAADRYPAAAADPAPGWRRIEHGPWVDHLPPRELPEQGWKIHVSAVPAEAPRVIELVLEHCRAAGLAVKFLRSPQALLRANGKYADRRSSGKLLTVYPPDEAALRTALEELSGRLEGVPGPYVLSDLRWGEGPLYLRYGSFTERWCTDPSGARVLALRGPDGTLVPDLRGTVFELPAWVRPPDFVAEEIDRAARRGAGEAFPFTVERALHFSNGGGVYLATDRRDGRRVVLREARPHAGLDQDGRDAVERLLHERDVLRALAGLDFVPELHEHLRVWEHHYLVEEYIEGEPLEVAFTRRCPLAKPEPSAADLAEHTRWALDVLDQLERMLARLHERGLAFGDLHPGNVLIRPDGRCALVDFEVAFPLDAPDGPTLGAPGFVSQAARRGPAVDAYALAALRLYLFLPLNMLVPLDSGKAALAAREISRLYPVPAGFERGALDAFDRAVGGRPPGGAVQRAGGPPAPAWPQAPAADTAAWRAAMDSLAAGILAAATPERADRLFPGDVAQFDPGPQALGLAHGTAGVLYALHACGYPVPDEHLDRLHTAALRTPEPAPGLYHGLTGVAWALRRLGRPQQAADLMTRVLATDPPDGPGLAAGRAGLAVGLLDLAEATGDRAFADRAFDLARTLAAGADRGRPARGLLAGGTGLAALFLRLYEHTGEEHWLAAAERALHAEVRDAATTDGMLALREEGGNRLLPYLGAGGVGTGLVIAANPALRAEPALAAALAAADRACRPRLVAAPGLFEGRAGLILHLARRAGDPAARAVLDRQLAELSWQLVGLRGQYAVPGRRLHRLSTDLATGAAGVLLAVHEATAGPVPLPGITDFPRY
ncbi:class III lanthionine synthetase LanKC [Kitasatospora sp. NPDC049258]|uniref:class III lanthionine synthetase LanKC n=1 Tax=Kitasatospora sp. NPDC049258 TaxID=3155394 RepID=UPI003413D8F2